ncbi:MAG: hypothetical protein ACI94Y_001327 [Maribacter sp.]|jgi:hypothetical protein
MLSLQERIDVLVELGHYLQLKDERLNAHLVRTKYNNKWFTVENQLFATDAISSQLLSKEKLEKWVLDNNVAQDNAPKKIGFIPNTNHPISVFQDLMSAFIYGHISFIKLSKEDKYLLPFLVKKMEEIKTGTADYFQFPEHLPFKEMNAIIASGNEGMVKQFNQYFKDKKLIAKTNKKSIGIIKGDETKDDFRKLAIDTLTYFGKGNRNISKIYVPTDYDFNLLLEAFHESKDIIKNTGYKNNYDYQITILILNQAVYWNNGSMILAEKTALASPLSVLNFEYYNDVVDLENKINLIADNIENIVANSAFDNIKTVPYGSSLIPSLDDYENDINVVDFLKGI